VRYGVEHEHLLVWLDVPERVGEDRGGVLCRRHADSMVVPVGWTLDDRREPAPRLFRTPGRSETVEPLVEVTRRRARPAPKSAPLQLDLSTELERPDPALADHAADFDGPDDADSPADPAPGAASGDGTGWMPVFDQADDLDGLLTPTTPLLARAFQQRDRRTTRPG
jgi:hypothetical protein